MARFRFATLWVVAILVLLGSPGPRSAAASPLESLAQPAFTPRRALVHRPLRVYADPSVPAERAGLNQISLVDLHRALRRVVRQDPRQREGVTDLSAFFLGLEQDTTVADLATLARQAARIGINHFRSYQMATAIDELESALATFQRTALPISQPQIVAEAHFYLALASLELARLHAEDATRHLARARLSLREVVRLDPTRQVTPAEYPSAVVNAWNDAWAEHFVESGEDLGLTASEARWLADRADVDTIVDAYALVELDRLRFRVRVWSRRRGAFALALDRLVEAEPTSAAVSEALERELLAFFACEPLLPPPPPPTAETDRGSVHLVLGAASALFLDLPTRGQIVHIGGAFGATWTLTDTFALGVDTQLLFSQRDRFGDLVRRVDTVRTTISALATNRWGRWRLEGGSGIEITHMSPVRATSSFWCRVSEGQPTVFDAERACRAGDVTRSAASTLVGIEVRARALVQAVGPIWLHATFTSSVYVLPFANRTFDFPLSVALGTSYRF